MATNNMILILFIALFLFYCYKKKKFPFSKFRKGNELKQTKPVQDTASAPGIYPFPWMFEQGTQCPFVSYPPVHPRPVYCKVIGVDTDVIGNDTDIEHVIDTELEKLTVMNCTVQSVCALQYAYGVMDGTGKTRVLFCIIYTR